MFLILDFCPVSKQTLSWRKQSGSEVHHVLRKSHLISRRSQQLYVIHFWIRQWLWQKVKLSQFFNRIIIFLL